MPMISYAHNAEDVVLARAFAGLTRGFYVDIGAGHPEVDSATRHLAGLGWHGVNVEPRSDELALLVAGRPRDVNLGVVLSDRSGVAVRVGGCTVTTTTLQAVLEEHADGAIDLLRIAAEGHEGAVLAGADLDTWRPRVVVVRSLPVDGGAPPDRSWEPGLLAQGYGTTLFDGVNRFYVRHDDRSGLGAALAAPANVLDDFVPFRVQDQLDRLGARVRSLETDLHATQDTADALRDELHRVGQAAEAARRVAADEGLRRMVSEQAALDASRELTALRGTATFRYTTGLRRLYGTVLHRPARG